MAKNTAKQYSKNTAKIQREKRVSEKQTAVHNTVDVFSLCGSESRNFASCSTGATKTQDLEDSSPTMKLKKKLTNILLFKGAS